MNAFWKAARRNIGHFLALAGRAVAAVVCTALTTAVLTIPASTESAAENNSAGGRTVFGGFPRAIPRLPSRHLSQDSWVGPAEARLESPASLTVSYGPIDYPRILGNGAVGINKKGQIVGCVAINVSTASTDAGYLLTANSFRQISFPGPFQSCTYAINDSGEIVGNYNRRLEHHSRLFTCGQGLYLDPGLP